jgi:hypothetical protein
MGSRPRQLSRIWWAVRDSLSGPNSFHKALEGRCRPFQALQSEREKALLQNMRDSCFRPVFALGGLNTRHHRALSSSIVKRRGSRLSSYSASPSPTVSEENKAPNNHGHVQETDEKRMRGNFNNGWREGMKNRPVSKKGEKSLSQAQSRVTLQVADPHGSRQDPTHVMNTDFPVPPYLWMRHLEMSKRSYLPLHDYKIGQHVKLRAQDWDRILLQVHARNVHNIRIFLPSNSFEARGRSFTANCPPLANRSIQLS